MVRGQLQNIPARHGLRLIAETTWYQLRQCALNLGSEYMKLVICIRFVTGLLMWVEALCDKQVTPVLKWKISYETDEVIGIRKTSRTWEICVQICAIFTNGRLSFLTCTWVNRENPRHMLQKTQIWRSWQQNKIILREPVCSLSPNQRISHWWRPKLNYHWSLTIVHAPIIVLMKDISP